MVVFLGAARGVACAMVAYVVLYWLIVSVLALLTPMHVYPSGRRQRLRFRALFPRLLGHDGFSLFGVTWIAEDKTTADLVAHEYDHNQQERELLYVGYPPVYLWCRLRDGSYFGNRMEARARAFSLAHVREFTDVAAVAT